VMMRLNSVDWLMGYLGAQPAMRIA
jgi:hypothetical protein